MGGVFIGIAGIVWWRGHPTLASVFVSVGGLLLLLGLLVPGHLGPVYRAWMGLAVAISKVTTPIFMALVYYLVITPIGILRRVVGRNPMVHAPENGTYWHGRDDGHRKGDLNRQF